MPDVEQCGMGPIGFLNICKLPGKSSHDVVGKVRLIAGTKRVGHTGTLDPSACGVMLICLGPATRLADYVSGGVKAYRAEITFGLATDSDDAEGDVIACADAGHLDEAAILALLPRFSGTFQQCPPAHSAVWIGGRRAYHMARGGEEVTIAPREVTIHSFAPVRFVAGARARLLADIVCSKGTYIRSLARDLGQALGVGGVLSFLARTEASGQRLEDAVTVDELAVDGVDKHLIPADALIQHIPAITIPPDADYYLLGCSVRVAAEPGLYRVYLDTRFVGLGTCAEGRLRPKVNFRE